MTDRPNGPAQPVPAASILLLRDAPGGLQVFMVVRHHQIDFASGALVFPGGKADPQDFDDALIPYLSGADSDRNMRAIQVSAIREAFEECGVLLARPQGESELVSAGRVAQLERFREPLNSGAIGLLEFLRDEQLVLACDLLVHYSHWITPAMMPKRFDTHFYLAYAPDDHVALHDGYESVDSVWISPRIALQEAEQGKRTVIFPTLRNLDMLAETETVTDAIAAARKRRIVPVEPWTEQRDDGTYLCIPADAGYAVSEVKMPPRPQS